MAKTAVFRGPKELEAEVLEQVQNGIILHPDETAVILADSILHSQGTDCLKEFARTLLFGYLVRAIRAERRKARPKPETLPLFPGLRNLPRRIVTPEGKRPLLAKSTATEIRTYVKSLNAKHRERIAELQAVLEIMGKYITHNRGITVAEVADRESE